MILFPSGTPGSPHLIHLQPERHVHGVCSLCYLGCENVRPARPRCLEKQVCGAGVGWAGVQKSSGGAVVSSPSFWASRDERPMGRCGFLADFLRC